MTVVEGMVTVCMAGAGVGLVGIVAHVCLELKRLQAGYYSPEYWKCQSEYWRPYLEGQEAKGAGEAEDHV